MKEIKLEELENLDELDELEYNYELENFDEASHVQLASFLRKTPKKGRKQIEEELQQEELQQEELQQEELRKEELKKKSRAKKARIRKRRRKIFFFSFIIFYFCSLFLCYSFATKRAEERNNSTESHWYYDTNEETEAILVSTKPQCGLVDFLSFIPNFNNDNFFISHIYWTMTNPSVLPIFQANSFLPKITPSFS